MDTLDTIRNYWENTFHAEFSSRNVLFLLFSFLVIYYISGFLKRRRNLPPGPIGLPWLGYFPFLGKKPYETLRNLSKKYGNVFSIYLGQKFVVICNDWDSVKEVFSKASTANRPTGLFDALPNGLGIGGINGQEWTEQRRFSVKTMKDIGLGGPKWEALIQEEVDEATEEIKALKGKPVDLLDLLSGTFTKNIMTLMLGYRLPPGDPMPRHVSRVVDHVIQQFPALGMGTFLPKLYMFFMKLGIIKSLMPQLLEFSDFMKKSVQQRLKSHEDDDEVSFVKKYFDEVQNNKKSNTKNSFTDNSLYGNTQSLILGGSDTTRTSIILLLAAMAEHQDKQDKVHEELDRVLGRDGKITWAARSKIPYTYATIMESQRWRTVAPINTLRMTVEDITVNGYDVPKNTIIVANNWALHNDPKYWLEPEKFRPERFLLNEGTQINFKPDSYVPFSYGKRSCPGELIATMEILLYFTHLMQNFQVFPEVGKIVKYKTILGLTFQPIGVKLRLVSRE